jgi:hypothetical protein
MLMMIGVADCCSLFAWNEQWLMQIKQKIGIGAVLR